MSTLLEKVCEATLLGYVLAMIGIATVGHNAALDIVFIWFLSATTLSHFGAQLEHQTLGAAFKSTAIFFATILSISTAVSDIFDLRLTFVLSAYGELIDTIGYAFADVMKAIFHVAIDFESVARAVNLIVVALTVGHQAKKGIRQGRAHTLKSATSS